MRQVCRPAPAASAVHATDDGVEQRIAGTLQRIHGDLGRLYQIDQTLFAFVDALAKAVLTALPEQTSPSSSSKAKARYERLLKSAAAALLDGVPAPMKAGDAGQWRPDYGVEPIR